MTADRPLLPRIRRVWDTQTGRMVWGCDELPAGRWGLGVSQQARYDWRRAWRWCSQKNAEMKEKNQ